MNDGGAAFPRVEYECFQGEVKSRTNREKGMSLRDYFAAKAMQGIIVGVENPNEEYIAKIAYAMADAMLAERDKK